MENLRECPFCENKDIRLFYWDEALVWKLECSVCFVTYTHTSKEKIIKLWNERVGESNLRDKITLLGAEIEKSKASYIDMQNKRDGLQIQVNALKQDVQNSSTLYANVRKEADALKNEIDILKGQLQTTRISLTDMQNKNDILQKTIDKYKVMEKEHNDLENKLAILREEAQVLRVSYTNMKKERDVVQSELDAIKENLQTAASGYNDIQNKYANLEKLYNKTVKQTEDENSSLQVKLNSERETHQRYMSTLQTRVNLAEETLVNIISSFNTKLDAIRLDEHEIASAVMKKIVKEINEK